MGNDAEAEGGQLGEGFWFTLEVEVGVPKPKGITSREEGDLREVTEEVDLRKE